MSAETENRTELEDRDTALEDVEAREGEAREGDELDASERDVEERDGDELDVEEQDGDELDAEEQDGDELDAEERDGDELDAETRARRDAALRHVRKLGDPVLRTTALPVERFDEDLRLEAQRMDELMQAALGIGLAATQVGILHRVLVYRAYPEDPTTVLVNPVLEWASDERESANEGCLSLPGVHVEVERSARVRVRARDVTGSELQIEAEGLEARVIQHEIDHLDGVLILDRISREARREAMRALREEREGRDVSRDAAPA